MIKIYDVSAIIYSGGLASYSKNWNKNYFPTGGLYKLFGYLLKDIKDMKLNENPANGNNIFLCFDSLNNGRKLIYPEYKVNRKTNKSTLDRKKVSCQIKAAKMICDYVGFNALELDGYEADDLIYSLAYKFKDDHVVIRADDSDLEGVKLFSNKIFISSVSGRNTNVINEFILGEKLAYGDNSDNIPGISKAYRNYVVAEYKKNPYEFFNPNFNLRKYFKDLPNPVFEQLELNYKLIIPKVLEVNKVPKFKYNKEKLINVMNGLAFKKYMKNYLKMERQFGTQGEIEFITKLIPLLDDEVKEYFLENEKIELKKKEYRNNKGKEEDKSVRGKINSSVGINNSTNDLEDILKTYKL